MKLQDMSQEENVFDQESPRKVKKTKTKKTKKKLTPVQHEAQKIKKDLINQVKSLFLQNGDDNMFVEKYALRYTKSLTDDEVMTFPERDHFLDVLIVAICTLGGDGKLDLKKKEITMKDKSEIWLQLRNN